MIYNSIGHDEDVYTQQDGFCKRLLWNMMQYVSGDASSDYPDIPDTEKPVITLFGSNRMQVELNSAFTDPGYICMDNKDGEIPITRSSNVNTNALGNYEIIYNCRDTAGNDAITVRRSVKVAVDTIDSVQVTPIAAVLLFEKSPTHFTGRQALKAALQELAAEQGFQLDVTEDHNVFTLDNLQQYQMVIWSNNDGGNSVIPPGPLQDDFQAYVEGGGGFLAVHAAGAFIQDWPWLYAQIVQPYWHYNDPGTYAKLLLDSEVQSNPATAMIAENLPATITMSDEWFSFRNSPRYVNEALIDIPDINPDYLPTDVTVILALDEGSYNPVTTMGDHPIAWAHTIGKGKVVYNSMGHDADVYTQNGGFGKNLLWNTMRYVAGDYSP